MTTTMSETRLTVNRCMRCSKGRLSLLIMIEDPMAYAKREQDGAYRYDIHFQPTENGTLVYGVHVLPNQADLPNVYDLGLILWA
jgi:hypothetical protein